MSARLSDRMFPAGTRNERVPSAFIADEGAGVRRSPALIARDGSRLLREFFEAAPAPRSGEEGITVPFRFRALVPEAWKGATRFYRYFHRGQVRQPSSLLICGSFFPETTRIGTVRSLFARAKAAADRRAPGARVCFMFRICPLNSGLEEASAFLHELHSAFYENFGLEADAWTAEQLLSREDYGAFAFVDFTSARICADSRLTQHLISGGAVPLLPAFQGLAQEPSSAVRIPLSGHHGIELMGDVAAIAADWRRTHSAIRALELTARLAERIAT